uniref:Uncharacterized protein n=1 Tax=Meloidogyne incognita TaxID=6306 RepID=A0A914NWN3_MELIC
MEDVEEEEEDVFVFVQGERFRVDDYFLCGKSLAREVNAFPAFPSVRTRSSRTFLEAGFFMELFPVFPDLISQKNQVGSDLVLITNLKSDSKNFDFAVYYS